MLLLFISLSFSFFLFFLYFLSLLSFNFRFPVFSKSYNLRMPANLDKRQSHIHQLSAKTGSHDCQPNQSNQASLLSLGHIRCNLLPRILLVSTYIREFNISISVTCIVFNLFRPRPPDTFCPMLKVFLAAALKSLS